MTDSFPKYDPSKVKSPGEVLKETLSDLGMQAVDFLVISNIDDRYFYRFLAGRAPLSDEMAERLERWAKIPKWLWWRHERNWQAHQKRLRDQQGEEPDDD